MIKLIITKFWPVFIPIIIFIIWQFFILPRIKTKKEYKQLMASYILVVSSIIALILSLLLFFFSENKKTRFYTPATIIGDEIKPAIVE
mgnify:CR=1 FL=1